MNQYEAFCLYTALKLHFNSSYDFIKYNGKTKSLVNAFEKLGAGKFIFQKLAKYRDLQGFLISNFLVDDYHYSQLKTQECENNFLQWQKRIQSLTYLYKEDLKKLDEIFEDNFKARENLYPKVISLYIQKKISLETLIILLDITKSSLYFKQILQDDVVWQKIEMKISKYIPFFEYDRNKFGKITFQFFKEKELI